MNEMQKRLRHILHGRLFTIITDHQALRHIVFAGLDDQ